MPLARLNKWREREMPVTVTIGNNARHGMQVHKPGCADIARAKKKLEVNSDWNIEVADGMTPLAAAVADLNAGFGWPDSYDEGDAAPWSEHDVRVLPCVGKK